MKIAIVTDANKTISYRFGKAMIYADLTVDVEQIETGEIREKTGHLDYQSEGLVGQGGHQLISIDKIERSDHHEIFQVF